ncbi:MAG: phage tail protein I [Muribaculaceae bacterium]|nr:phage tail protein I [Muribaculaceae bacterium]MCM1439326.1 phage tail protein I [Roseburia sp.]
MIKSLRQASITDGLPRVVAGQPWVIALSEALGMATEKTLGYIDESQIYTNIDGAAEEVLDALAVNWKIDWYDTGFTLEQKRRTVKTALTVRRLMGTAEAVKLQTDAIYPGAEIEEWFQYGGEAGRFRVRIILPDGGITAEEYRRLIHGIEITKNIRCHLEAIDISRETQAALTAGGYVSVGRMMEVWPETAAQVEVTGGIKAAGQAAAQRAIEIYPEGRGQE